MKLRLDVLSGDNQTERPLRLSEPNTQPDADPTDDAESQMRKALGLLGETPRHRPDADRSDASGRMGDRFNGGLHRRRFVQDGDVPVTVLRRDQGHEAPASRIAPAAVPPTTSRLQRTEAALAAETGAREKAERLLVETQSVVRDLQTKIGHAELAKNEAIEALRQEREAVAQIRGDDGARQARLQEALARADAAEASAQAYQDQLHEERQVRRNAEKALRAAETARDAAEQLARTLADSAAKGLPPVGKAPGMSVEPPRRARPLPEPEVVAVTARRGRPPNQPDVAEAAATEPEPVKWWLNVKPGSKRR